jgi:hypothetical protein
LNKIYPLKDGFGLLDESGSGLENSFLSLIFLDLHRHTLQKLHTVEYRSDLSKIIVNKTDPTTFILTYGAFRESFWKICRIVDNAIIIGDVIETKPNPGCFYDKFAYSVDWNDGIGSRVSLLFTCIINSVNVLEN